MPIELPKTSPYAAERFPLQPRRVQQWLNELPALDLGQTAQSLREALGLANRQEAAPKARMESMELLREAAMRCLARLRRQLVARSLPLSVKTQAAFRLHQDLNWELQTGYAIVLQGSTGKGLWPSRAAALATHRALDLLYREGRMALELYQSLRPGFWKRVYGIYRCAETTGTLSHTPKDDSPAQNLFLHLVLLVLAHPYSLRHGELGKFAEFLRSARPPCLVLRELAPNASGYVSHFDLESDGPPEYAPVGQVEASPRIRTVHLEPLLEQLSELARSTGPGLRTAIIDRSTLPSLLSRKLIENLTSVPARRFSRIPRDDHVEVVFGLGAIHTALVLARRRMRPPPGQGSRAGEVLQQVDSDLIADPAFGTGRYAPNTAASPDDPEHKWQLWNVVNLGAGGYQLHWPQLRPSCAQVGELLVVRTMDGGQARVYAGAVRWMQARSEGDLDIGVQLLGPKVVPLDIQPEDDYLVDNLSTEPGLWLPEVKAIRQPATVVTPVDRYRPGTRVVVTGSRGSYLLELSDQIESTGLFERFSYRVLGRQSRPPGYTTT